MAGRLEVITGCMFAGKTEELLRRVERAVIAKKKVIIFKPEIDIRYLPEAIVTHYGRSLPCLRLPLYISFEELTTQFPAVKEAEVIAFDEAHFFGSDFPKLCEELVKLEKRVIVAGLDLNFRGEPFGTMPILLALADEVLKLKAVCPKCGEEATRTQRLVNGEPAKKNDPLIVIGGLEKYEPRCRRCWVEPK